MNKDLRWETNWSETETWCTTVYRVAGSLNQWGWRDPINYGSGCRWSTSYGTGCLETSPPPHHPQAVEFHRSQSRAELRTCRVQQLRLLTETFYCFFISLGQSRVSRLHGMDCSDVSHAGFNESKLIWITSLCQCVIHLYSSWEFLSDFESYLFSSYLRYFHGCWIIFRRVHLQTEYID